MGGSNLSQELRHGHRRMDCFGAAADRANWLASLARHPGRTNKAISVRKSWKPSERDRSSGLHRLVGDFVSEDHLFIDLMINYHLQSLDPRLALRGRCGRWRGRASLQRVIGQIPHANSRELGHVERQQLNQSSAVALVLASLCL